MHTEVKTSTVEIELYLIEICCINFEQQDDEAQYFLEVLDIYRSVAIRSHVNFQLVGKANFNCYKEKDF